MSVWTGELLNNVLSSNTYPTTIGKPTFTPDGLRVHYCQRGYSRVWEVTLSTPFDVSTAGGTTYITNSTDLLYCVSLKWADNGSTCYFLLQNCDVVKMVLSAAYDITTMVYSSKSSAMQNSTDAAYDFEINPAGTRIYVVRGSNKYLYQYNMTAWDISTLTYSTKELTISIDTLAFNSSGFQYVSAYNGYGHLYDLSTAWEIDNYVQSGNRYYGGSNYDTHLMNVPGDAVCLRSKDSGELVTSTFEVTVEIAGVSPMTASFVNNPFPLLGGV